MVLETFVLEKQRAIVQQIVDRQVVDYWAGNDPQFTIRELSDVTRNLVLQLSSYIAKQQAQPVALVEKTFEISVEVHLPNSLWDWLKYTYFPCSWQRWDWLRPKLTRFFRVQKEKIIATTDVEIVYPKLRIAIPNEQLIICSGNIRWTRREE